MLTLVEREDIIKLIDLLRGGDFMSEKVLLLLTPDNTLTQLGEAFPASENHERLEEVVASIRDALEAVAAEEHGSDYVRAPSGWCK